MEFLPKKHKSLRIDRKIFDLVELEKLYLWQQNQPSISFLWEDISLTVLAGNSEIS
jgi:hypothetical protein